MMLGLGTIILGLGTLSLISGAGSVQAQSGCAETRISILKAAAVTLDDVLVVPCRDEKPAPLTFDRRAKQVFTSEPLPAGSYLGSISFIDAPLFSAGERAVLVHRTGTITVRQPVMVLQTAKTNGRVFVETLQGQSLSVPVSGSNAWLERFQ